MRISGWTHIFYFIPYIYFAKINTFLDWFSLETEADFIFVLMTEESLKKFALSRQNEFVSFDGVFVFAINGEIKKLFLILQIGFGDIVKQFSF